MNERNHRRAFQADGPARRRRHHGPEAGHQRSQCVPRAGRRHGHQYVHDHRHRRRGAARNPPPPLWGRPSSVTASALLRGARGNSGVILSLLFRGLSKSLKGMETADAAAFAAAMQEGVAAAYKAVMKPAEGTVLTVSRLAAKRAVEAAAEGADVEAMLAAAIRGGLRRPGPDHRHEPGSEKGRRGGCRRQGLPADSGGNAGRAAGRTHAREHRGALRRTRKRPISTLMAQEEITFTFDTVFMVRKAREDIDLDAPADLPQQHRRQPGDRRGRRDLQGSRPHRHPRRAL